METYILHKTILCKDIEELKKEAAKYGNCSITDLKGNLVYTPSEKKEKVEPLSEKELEAIVNNPDRPPEAA